MKFGKKGYEMNFYFEKMTKYSRVGHLGKLLLCPNCKQCTRVFHLSFSAIMCDKCNKMIEKYKWRIQKIIKYKN